MTRLLPSAETTQRTTAQQMIRGCMREKMGMAVEAMKPNCSIQPKKTTPDPQTLALATNWPSQLTGNTKRSEGTVNPLCLPWNTEIKCKPTCCCYLLTKLCPTLCNSMDYGPPGSSVHGILQARILEWGAISTSRGSSRPRDWSRISCIDRRVFHCWATREAWKPTKYTENLSLYDLSVMTYRYLHRQESRAVFSLS